MKNFFRIILLIVFNSCTFYQRDWYDVYKVENNTKLSVNIEAHYLNYQVNLVDSFSINAGDYYQTEKTYGEGGQESGVFRFGDPDSVIIKFEDNRYIIQKCDYYNSLNPCDIEKNLINYYDYYERIELDGKKDGRYLYVYSITEDDYNESFHLDSL